MRPALALLLAVLVLAACGKVGRLELPPAESERAEPAS